MGGKKLEFISKLSLLWITVRSFRGIFTTNPTSATFEVYQGFLLRNPRTSARYT